MEDIDDNSHLFDQSQVAQAAKRGMIGTPAPKTSATTKAEQPPEELQVLPEGSR